MILRADWTFQVPVHHFAEHCHRRLDRTMQSGAKRGVRKPTIEEIEQAKVSSLDFVYVHLSNRARDISVCV